MAEITCGTGLWGNAPKPGDPDNVLGISATPAFGGINVEWSYPTTNPQGVAYFELYRSLNESFDTAVHHQTVNGTFFYDRIENDTTTVYYYWIRSVSVNGTIADPIGPASASARPLIADLIEALTNKIDKGVLAQSLQVEINRINVVEELLNTEVGNRLLAISSLQDTFSALEYDTLGTLSDFNDTINELLNADTLFVEELNNISTTLGEADDRITAVRAELAAEDLRLDQKADAIEGALNAAQQALELKDQELTDALEQNVNDFTSLKEVYETESSVTANTITGILARVEDNEAALGSLQRIQVEKDLIEALQFDYIKAETTNRVAAFRTQELVRVTAEEALAQRIDEQVTRVDGNVAEISSLATTVSNNNSALASRISELSAKLDATPTFASGWELGSDYDQWIARPGNTITPVATSAYSGNQSALVESTNTSPTSGSWTDGVYANIPEGTTTAFKGFQVTIRLWAKKPSSNAASQAALSYSTKDAGNSGWLYFTLTDSWQQFEFSYSVPGGSNTTSHVIGIWGDTSGSGKGTLVDGLTITQTASELSDVSAAIEAQQEALVNLEESVASDFQSIESRFNGVEADIQNESSTRTSELEAMAQTLQDLDASLGNAQSSLTSLEQTQASQSTALASRTSSLESRVGDAESNISTLEESSSSLESSLATKTSQLQSQIDDNKSSITTEASTRSTAIDNTVNLITALRGEYEGTAGLVANHSTLIQNNQDTIAQNVTAVQAARDDAESLVAAEETARINAISAQASRTDGVITRMGAAESNISSLTTGLSDANQALSTYQSTVSSEFEDVRGTLNTAVTSLSQADSSMVERVDGLTATVGDLETGTTAGLLEEAQIRAERDSAQAKTSSELAARLGDAEAALVAESRINAEKEFIEAIQFDAIEVAKAGATAGMQTETQIRIEDGLAFAQQLNTIGAEVEANMATILEDYETKADAESARATLGSVVYSRIDSADAAIVSERNTRTTQISNLSSDIAQEAGIRQGAISSLEDSVSAEASARNSAINAVDGRVDTVNSRVTDVDNKVDTVDGRVTSEASTRNQQVSGLSNLLNSEIQDREDGDEALDTKISNTSTELTQQIASVSNQVDLVSATAADATAALKTELQAQVLGKSIVADGSFLAGDGSLWSSTKYWSFREKDPDSSDSLYSGAPAANFAVFDQGITYDKAHHITNKFFQVSPGEEYSFSFWCAKFNAADGRVRYSVQWYKSNGQIVSWPTLTYAQLSTMGNREWEFFGSYTSTVPAGATRGRIVVTFEGDNTKGGAAVTAFKGGVVDSALAERIDSVQTSAGDNLAAFEQAITTEINTTNGKLDSIGALYTAKVQANGLIGGFGVFNDGTEVQAGFDVDTFWVGRTNDDKVKPFIVVGDEVFINEAVINKLTFSKLTDESGSFIVQNGKVKAAYIEADQLEVEWGKLKNVDIQWGTIRNVSIDSADIENESVTTSKIDNLAVTYAKIRDAAVDTLKIKGDAVTVPVGAYTSGRIDVGDKRWVTVQELNINPEGSPCMISGGCRIDIEKGFGSGERYGMEFRILRGGAVVASPGNLFEHQGINNYDEREYVDEYRSFTILDSSTSGGNRNYKLQINFVDGDANHLRLWSRTLVAIGLKR